LAVFVGVGGRIDDSEFFAEPAAEVDRAAAFAAERKLGVRRSGQHFVFAGRATHRERTVLTSSPPVEKRTVLAMILFVTACRETKTGHVELPPPGPACGDGEINPGEECEGSDLGEASCKSLGFDQGQLSCGADCKFIKTQCSKRCGNGVIDPGEACDGKLGVGSCLSFGYQACTPACQLEVIHCVPTLLQGAPALQVLKGGPAVVADLEPKGLGDLVMAVPSFGRVETFGYRIEQGFLTDRKLSFGRTPVAVAAADLDGDGRMDLASIDADGAIDRYLYSGSSFVFGSLPDAGCPATRFIGASSGTDAGSSLLALGCADAGTFGGLVIQRLGQSPLTLGISASAGTLADLDADGRMDVLLASGSSLTTFLAPGWDAGATQSLPFAPSEIAAGDFDGDGDLDLAALSSAGVALWENTGVGFAAKSAFPAVGARALNAVDLDLDGRVDLLWQVDDKVQIRRNLSGWSFASTEGTLGAGAPISLSVGDADGDGDLDIASTHSAGGDATVTYVLVNKVR
jgi:hypothetical protein